MSDSSLSNSLTTNPARKNQSSTLLNLLEPESFSSICREGRRKSRINFQIIISSKEDRVLTKKQVPWRRT
jgi:hypothetical protein